MKEITANMDSYIITSFEADEDLKTIMYEFNLTDEEGNKEALFYEVANTLYNSSRINELIDSGLSAYDIYNYEIKKYEDNISYIDSPACFFYYL